MRGTCQAGRPHGQCEAYQHPLAFAFLQAPSASPPKIFRCARPLLAVDGTTHGRRLVPVFLQATRVAAVSVPERSPPSLSCGKIWAAPRTDRTRQDARRLARTR